jgi:hypothetical protein
LRRGKSVPGLACLADRVLIASAVDGAVMGVGLAGRGWSGGRAALCGGYVVVLLQMGLGEVSG